MGDQFFITFFLIKRFRKSSVLCNSSSLSGILLDILFTLLLSQLWKIYLSTVEHTFVQHLHNCAKRCFFTMICKNLKSTHFMTIWCGIIQCRAFITNSVTFYRFFSLVDFQDLITHRIDAHGKSQRPNRLRYRLLTIRVISKYFTDQEVLLLLILNSCTSLIIRLTIIFIRSDLQAQKMYNPPPSPIMIIGVLV